MDQLNPNNVFVSTLNNTRDKIINLIITIFTFFYVPSIISSLLRIQFIGFHPIMILHIATCPILIALYILRNKLGTKKKILVVNILFLLISLAGYLSFGFLNSVSVSSILCIMIMSVLLGKKAGKINFIIMLIIPILSFIGFKTGFLKYDVSTNMLLTNNVFWITHLIPLIMVSIIIISSLGKIYESLIKIIADMKEQNSELLHSRNNYKKLLEFLPDAIILKHKSKFIYANTAAVKLFKASNEQELLDKSSFDLTHENYLDVLDEILEKQKKGENLEKFVVSKLIAFDGEIIDVEISHIVLEPKEDQMYLTVFHDISERIKTENATRLLIETQESEKLRTEFFANLSHELRTPVSVISGALQLMEIDTSEGNSRKYVGMIKQNCYRLIRLIDNLIDSTKIDVGFLKLNLSCNNIVSVIEEIAMSVSSFIESNGMTLVFDTEIEEKYLNIDTDAFERIMLNLISNSVKFRKENGTILIRIFDKGDSILISIKDDGIGIPLEHQENIFDRFKKVDRSFTRKAEGSGIGLSIVKSLVELHKGTIELLSEEDVGSEFIIELPALDNWDAHQDKIKELSNKTSQKASIEFSDIYSAS